jgi:hypothetical protein
VNVYGCYCCGRRDGLTSGGCLHCGSRVCCAACGQCVACMCGRRFDAHVCPNVRLVGIVEIVSQWIVCSTLVPTGTVEIVPQWIP